MYNYTEIKKTQKANIKTLYWYYRKLKSNPYCDLYNCYSRPSYAKQVALEECKEERYYYSNEHIHESGIITYNINCFSYGFITDKHFYFITKNNAYKVKIEYFKEIEA